jgi:heme oxygenase
LRQATLESHERIDLAVSKLRLQDTADYGAFLNLHYSVLQALQSSWRTEDELDFRSFAACLDADLCAIGVARSNLPLAPMALAPALGKLGVAYVIRGSRLGSKFLRQRVPASFATSYFDCQVTLPWAAFLQELDGASNSAMPRAACEVIDGAKQTFELFLQLIVAWPAARPQ